MGNTVGVADNIVAILKEIGIIVTAIGVIISLFLQWQAKREAKEQARKQEELAKGLAVVSHQTNSINTALLAMATNSAEKLLVAVADANLAKGKEDQRVAHLEGSQPGSSASPLQVELAPGATLTGVVKDPETEKVEGKIEGLIKAPKK